MNAPQFPGLISSPAAVCPSILADLANTRFLKLCDALATCRQRCEGRGICPGLRKAVGSALRPKVACTGAGTPLHCGISVPSMSESGHNPNLPHCNSNDRFHLDQRTLEPRHWMRPDNLASMGD